MKRLWICLLAFALLTGCGDSGDIAVTTVYETGKWLSDCESSGITSFLVR